MQTWNDSSIWAKLCAFLWAQLIVLSFTLIISLMVGTFAVVYKVGGVRFNE